MGRVDLLVRSWIERLISFRRFRAISSRPPCEVVNWKTVLKPTIRRSKLSTSLWGRELKGCKRPNESIRNESTSLWGRELKDTSLDKQFMTYPSTSLWGRELKELIALLFLKRNIVDLLVRSWIERPRYWFPEGFNPCRPPCEVVNWKSSLHFF